MGAKTYELRVTLGSEQWLHPLDDSLAESEAGYKLWPRRKGRGLWRALLAGDPEIGARRVPLQQVATSPREQITLTCR